MDEFMEVMEDRSASDGKIGLKVLDQENKQ